MKLKTTLVTDKSWWVVDGEGIEGAISTTSSAQSTVEMRILSTRGFQQATTTVNNLLFQNLIYAKAKFGAKSRVTTTRGITASNTYSSPVTAYHNQAFCMHSLVRILNLDAHTRLASRSSTMQAFIIEILDLSM